MTSLNNLICDGCNQPASPAHIAKRLQRLEWTTRYRPVHIGTVLLGAQAPERDTDFLYGADGAFCEQAGLVLRAAGIAPAGKTPQAALAEFQRGGFLLTYVLECAVPQAGETPAIGALLEGRLPAALTRLRRSLRPKRIALISQALGSVTGRFANPEWAILLDGGKPFDLDSDPPGAALLRLTAALRRPNFVSG